MDLAHKFMTIARGRPWRRPLTCTDPLRDSERDKGPVRRHGQCAGARQPAHCPERGGVACYPCRLHSLPSSSALRLVALYNPSYRSLGTWPLDGPLKSGLTWVCFRSADRSYASSAPRAPDSSLRDIPYLVRLHTASLRHLALQADRHPHDARSLDLPVPAAWSVGSAAPSRLPFR